MSATDVDRRGFVVLAPHVDDEVLGCGGILDDRFHVHYFGVEPFREVGREARLAEAQACADRLGFSWTLGEDNVVNDYRVPALVGQVEALVETHQPHTVFVPTTSYNQDHRALFDAALTALRPHDRNHSVANVLLYEQVHVGLWPPGDDLARGRAFQPTCFFAIDIERKIEAYRCHASQVRGMRNPEAVEDLARLRGRQAGFPHAEGFLPVRLTAPERLVLGRR